MTLVVGQRFAAAWVRVRAAFDDGQSVSIQETTSIVRAFSYLSGSNGRNRHARLATVALAT